MPRLLWIVLEQPDPEGHPRAFRYALWADVPVARQPFYANPAVQSAWRDAIAADTTALQSGAMVERVDTLDAPVGMTIAQIQDMLTTFQADFQAFIIAHNPWARYGRRFDGTTITPGGVA